MSFEKPLLISVKNIDLSTSLKLICSLSEELELSQVVIRRSSRDA